MAAPDGKLLGSIPSPVSLITAAFAGPDKKTMYAVTSIRAADGTQSAEVYSIPMIAQGYKEEPSRPEGEGPGPRGWSRHKAIHGQDDGCRYNRAHAQHHGHSREATAKRVK